MAVRCDNGLCYYCADRWVSGHRCQPRMHLLIADDDSNQFPQPISDFPSPPLKTVSCPELEDTPQLSLHAMSGMSAPETFHAYGIIHHHRLTILVDYGSTYNFIQSRVVKFLPLTLTPIAPLHFIVGNGGIMEYTQYYAQVSITIQSYSFTVDLYALPLSDANIVLGVH